MIPSSSLPARALLEEDSLYRRRQRLLALLNNPRQFAEEAYKVTTLGYVLASPFGFVDSASYLPSQEERAAALLCQETGKSGENVVPYIFYQERVRNRPDVALCSCLEGKVASQLLCDEFTHQVLLNYLVDYLASQGNIPANYQQIKIAYFCSGRGHLLEEEVQPLPPLGEKNLYLLVSSLWTFLDYLVEQVSFSAPLVLEDIAFGEGLFKITNFSQARAIIETGEGQFCLIDRRREDFVRIDLDYSPCYYYSPDHRLPPSFSYYSLFLSLLSQPPLRKIFFSTSWGQRIWIRLFPREGQEMLRRLSQIETYDPSIFRGVALRCQLKRV